MPDRRRLQEEPGGAQRLLEELTEARQRVAELESAVLEEAARAREATLERAERELRIKEAMIDASVAGLALWDMEGAISYVNSAFLAMWGYRDPEDVQGRDIQGLLADDPQGATIQSSVEQVGGWIGKMTAIGQDGSPFTAMLSASLIREPDGTPSCVVGSFVEMTYRERLNTMLFQQSDWLRAVHEIDRGILSATSLEEIGERALTAIQALVPCARSSVTLLHPQDGEAELLAAVPEEDGGRAGRGARVPLTSFEETIEALQREEIRVVERALRPPLPASVLGLDKPAEPATYVLVPLSCEGQPLGWLNLVLEERDRLTNLDQSIARHFADSLAAAIHNAQLTAAVADLTEQLRLRGAHFARPDET
jgi:PAS domain S-box-containing protein